VKYLERLEKFDTAFINFENRRRDVISLYQPRGMSAKIGMLTYKNVNLRHRHSRHFWLTFLQAFNNCDCGRHIKRRAFINYA